MSATPTPEKVSHKRYKWAGELARIAMGKKKCYGEKPRDIAEDDPLAWWCLTEAIATGGPKRIAAFESLKGKKP